MGSVAGAGVILISIVSFQAILACALARYGVEL
jgi:hypothetical protein